MCDFGAPIQTHNNTIRFSVSYEDGQASLNGATGINWWTPSVLGSTLILGMTLVSNNTIPVIGPLESGGGSYPNVSVLSSALLSLGAVGSEWGSPVLNFVPAPPSANLSGNQYWSSPSPLVFTWGYTNYSSLSEFRNSTGQEKGPHGENTGSDADPGLSTSGAFFQDCVLWLPHYPAIPNSDTLDVIRGFSGC